MCFCVCKERKKDTRRKPFSLYSFPFLFTIINLLTFFCSPLPLVFVGAIFTVSKRPAFSTVVHSGSQSLKGHAHMCRKCVWMPEDDADDAGNVNNAGNATSQSPRQIVLVSSSLSFHLLSFHVLSLPLIVLHSHCFDSPSHCSCSCSTASIHHLSESLWAYSLVSGQ